MVETAAAVITDMDRLYFIADDSIKQHFLHNTEELKMLIDGTCPTFIFGMDSKDSWIRFTLKRDLSEKEYLIAAMGCIDKATKVFQIVQNKIATSILNQIELLYAISIEKEITTIFLHPGKHPIIV